MFDYEQVKKLFCRYKCNAKEKEVSVIVEYTDYCRNCRTSNDGEVAESVILDEEDVCRLCQVDNFIRELMSYDQETRNKVINSWKG